LAIRKGVAVRKNKKTIFNSNNQGIKYPESQKKYLPLSLNFDEYDFAQHPILWFYSILH
jgi:hypothetical protein